MKDKKNIIGIVFGVICAVILLVCAVIYIYIKNEDAELEKESEKYKTLIVKTKSGEKIETEYVHVDDEKYFIKIPKSFNQLDSETINKKYNGEVPGIVFSNDATTINVAISQTDNNMKDNQIKKYISDMEKLLKDSSEIVDTKYYEVDDHHIGQIKLISNAVDTKIYNNMICFSYKGKLIIINFNCTEELKNEWENVGDFIMDSLFFDE